MRILHAMVVCCFVLWSGRSGSAADSSATTSSAPAAAPTGPLIEGIVVNPMGGGIAGALVRIESMDAGADEPPLAETFTNQTGDIHVQLPEAVTGTVRVRIRRDGFAEHVSELELSEDELPFIDVTLPGASRLAGFVLRQADHEPISGVRVQCSNGGRNLECTSNEIGKYTFDSMYLGPATLTVSGEGYGTIREDIAIEADQNDLDVTLAPERPVELTIVTNDGDPAADVLVEAMTVPGHIYVHAVSDSNGQVTLNGINLETALLRLRLSGQRYLRTVQFAETVELPPLETAEQLPTTRPAPATAQLEVTVAGQVAGQVVDKQTGKPVVGVRMVAGGELRYDMPVAWTTLDGTYDLTGVRPGIVTVSFQHNSYAPVIREVDLHTGKTVTLDVQLEPGEPLAGVVVDDSGTPLDQVRVTAEEWRGHNTIGLRAITGEDGRFAFEHAPPGEITLSFVRPGFGRPQEEVLTAGKQDHRIVLEDASTPSPAAPPRDEVKIKPGEEVPDLVMTATDGTRYALSELRGRYVFLDCWASWCGPCRAEIPHVKSLHEATRGRPDFVLIGISLDTDRKALNAAIEENDMAWPQVFGPKSGAAEAFEALDGVGIPYTCFIGPDGKLIAQHLRGPEMVEEVRKHLPEKAEKKNGKKEQ